MNAPIFTPSGTRHSSLLKKNATLQSILDRINLAHDALGLCDRLGDCGFDSREDFRPILSGFRAARIEVAISKKRLLPPGFLSHPFAHELSGTHTRPKNPWADSRIRW